MDEARFKQRTKGIALGVIRLAEGLPKGRTADVIARQLLRSATSVGANYRAACRAKSPADMLAKLAIVEEQADETMYWLELAVEAGLAAEADTGGLWQETNEIVAMTVASIKTLRANHQSNNQDPKSKPRNRK